ncbi:MAG: sulfide/dihydroorotate dehydrogenase-like FAD/NAD-binding protein [Thermacetogeniaceae bacterium]
MNRIVAKKELAPGIKRLEVEAPEIAAAARPGQFVILRIDEKGERIPLTISDSDRRRGTIALVFREAGRTTMELGRLEAGDSIRDLAGPLGKPSEIKLYGKVVCVGGGVGIAAIYPIARALKEAGNEVISIIGARDRQQLILAEEMAEVSDALEVATDDGSAGRKGPVTAALKEVLLGGERIDRVVAVGPLAMMRSVAELTKPYHIRTIVSLNPIMIDGIGMCGACRLTVGGKTVFACVDGPEFNAHQVDWDVAMQRSRMFHEEERLAVEHYLSGSECRCGKG